MPATRGRRTKIAVITPSTNTSLEYDLNQLPLNGVSWHVGRMYLSQNEIATDEQQKKAIEESEMNFDISVRDVMTALPDHLMLGLSGPMFGRNRSEAEAHLANVRATAGEEIGITSPVIASLDALQTIRAKNIAILTPYQPALDEDVLAFFETEGPEVKRLHGLKRTLATEIAGTTDDELIAALRELDGDDVDAILQLGADLAMMRLADEAWRWLGKPVISINSACAWHALRALGIRDQFPGFGPLFLNH